MTDNDEAGVSCIFGHKNIRNPDKRDYETGALYHLYKHIPQLLVKYPDNRKDPCDCTDDELTDMIVNAKLFTGFK